MDYMRPIFKREKYKDKSKLQVYVWHRGKKEIYIDDLLIEKFGLKE